MVDTLFDGTYPLYFFVFRLSTKRTRDLTGEKTRSVMVHSKARGKSRQYGDSNEEYTSQDSKGGMERRKDGIVESRRREPCERRSEEGQMAECEDRNETA
jgi:hypothetical protein